jgi:hypothetical protein
MLGLVHGVRAYVAVVLASGVVDAEVVDLVGVAASKIILTVPRGVETAEGGVPHEDGVLEKRGLAMACGVLGFVHMLAAGFVVAVLLVGEVELTIALPAAFREVVVGDTAVGLVEVMSDGATTLTGGTWGVDRADAVVSAWTGTYSTSGAEFLHLMLLTCSCSLSASWLSNERDTVRSAVKVPSSSWK